VYVAHLSSQARLFWDRGACRAVASVCYFNLQFTSQL
jgi:hypothetical protein